ncbi:MAG: HAMP domain-containing sensor histidine kinase, partial [Catenibacillus sp.]|nr:HAMP domain-containing sensor histidine kinase [Catenibacillus sp.]
LKMAKLDAGAVTMKNEPFVIEALLHRAAEHLLIPMELKHITFELEGDMKAEISGDIGWLSEAVANILKNCIEHTPVGGRIVVHAEKTALYTSITISDTGCGIAEDDLSHIFERFYKGKNSSSDSVGIGLAMAKQIMTETNGTLAVTKTGERGTTFMLKLYRK